MIAKNLDASVSKKLNPEVRHNGQEVMTQRKTGSSKHTGGAGAAWQSACPPSMCKAQGSIPTTAERSRKEYY